MQIYTFYRNTKSNAMKDKGDIFIINVISKVFERVHTSLMRKKVDLRKYQCGGMKQRSTIRCIV